MGSAHSRAEQLRAIAAHLRASADWVERVADGLADDAGALAAVNNITDPEIRDAAARAYHAHERRGRVAYMGGGDE